MRDKLFEMLQGGTTCTIDKTSQWWEYLNQMLHRHPRAEAKIGAGVKAFSVRKKTKMGNTYPELFVHRVDGTTIDVSWRKMEKGKEHSQKTLFTSAMRIAVEGQISAFRRTLNADMTCGFCNEQVNGPVHIDHERPFADILKAFMEGRSMPLVDAEDVKGRRIISDHSFVAEWQAYHLAHAILRPAHPTCNLHPASVAPISLYIEKGLFS